MYHDLLNTENSLYSTIKVLITVPNSRHGLALKLENNKYASIRIAPYIIDCTVALQLEQNNYH